MEKRRLRLSVFISNKYTSAQIIDDEAGKTLVSAGEKDILDSPKGTKMEKAKLLGKILAQKAIKKGVKKISFDRGDRQYHGRVKALAEGAREGGLEF
jgi:large subunit ribosomal protein L18